MPVRLSTLDALFNARTLQRWQVDQSLGDQRPCRTQTPTNKLSVRERKHVLTVANSDEFGSLPPSQIVPILVDKRPAQRRHKPRALDGTAPNQLFSWNITYLPTPVKGIYFYLYLFMDIFSRKVVGWQIYDAESSKLASDVMRDICAREAIEPDQVVLHSDNGNPMKGAMMLTTLQALGVAPSLSRPAVSNDNPYSESLFKTLKYRSAYPRRAFESLLAARQ